MAVAVLRYQFQLR